ncbi:MAG: hypothetical protein JXB17_09785 [Bacteroidales bacterium]|nr:hypothetical protein [Bacteroidales bacterium]
MKKKFQITDWSILITVASTTLYVVFRNLGRELGSFTFLWAPITLILIFVKRPTTFRREPIRIILFYGIIMVGILQYALWRYMDEWNRTHILYELYYLLIITTILIYYLERGDLAKLALLGKWTFIFIIVSLLTTNIALFFDPYLVRQSAATGEFTQYQERIYRISGTMSYSYLQSIVCFIPIILYHIKNKKQLVFPSKILIIVLILILITLIRAQVFANVLIALLITVLSMVGSKKKIVTIISITLICIVLIFVSRSFYANISISLSSLFETNSEMYNKLRDFAYFIENPELDNTTEAGDRASRYPLLFNALIERPIFGHASCNNPINISGGAHLYWMNRLTLWGIPGFALFIFILYRIYRKVQSLFDYNYRFYYFSSVMAFVFLGLIKAIGGRESWLLLILVIPGIYYLPLLNKGKKRNKKIKHFLPV